MGFFHSFFKVIPACTSTIMFLSPIPSIYTAYKTKSTGVGSIVPLVSMLTNLYIGMTFGYLSELYFPVFWTSLLGVLLSLVYIAVFYRYSHEKPKAHKVFLGFGSALALVTLYAFIGGFGVTGQSRHAVGQIVGDVGIAATVILYTSPFEKINLVLKYKSAVFLNIHMVCAGTFNNAMWVCYGFMMKEWVIFAPNVFCFTMGCIQISLYMIYHPSTHPYDGSLPGQDADVEAARMGTTKAATRENSFRAIASPLKS